MNNKLNDEATRRVTGIFGSSDTTPMSPRAFFDQLFPTMARVYVEVSDEYKELGIVRMDRRVWDALVRVLNFDPAAERFQYAVDLNIQVWALSRSREAERALYLADEVEQLDGQAALDYAAGWMRALDYFEGLMTCPDGGADGCGKKYCPAKESVEGAIKREIGLFSPQKPELFISGYRKCIEEKTSEDRCVLATQKGI